MRGRENVFYLCACAVVLLSLSAARDGNAQTPTRIFVSDEGGRPSIAGERSPEAGQKLPVKARSSGEKSPVAVDDAKPAAIEAPAAKAAADPPDTPLGPALEIDFGYVRIPDGLWSTIAKLGKGGAIRDKHPTIAGYAIDLSYLHTIGPRSTVAARFGAALPLMADQNWYNSSGALTPLYSQLHVGLLDIAVDYIYRVPLLADLDWQLRAGLGLAVVTGSVTQTDVIPSCDPAAALQCAHWPSVGSSASSFNRIWPAIRATTGLRWQATKAAGIALDFGLRDGLYAGVGGAWAF